MRRLLIVLCGVAVAAAIASQPARAAGLNDGACKPSPEHPYPVVLAHGRSGHVEEMTKIIDALTAAGYCVFGEDYGIVQSGGQTGMDHLAASAGQFQGVVEKVLAATGAPKISAVGYDEGTAIIDNYILQQGGGVKVDRVVSFAGLHHPYGHVGIAKVIDATLFLPNVLAALRQLLPPFTSNIQFKDIVIEALALPEAVGLTQLGLTDVLSVGVSPKSKEVLESSFVSDLFDPAYWTALHGNLSEGPGAFVAVNAGTRGLITKDAAADVCYTNMISPIDRVVGASAGFQDEAPNVENVVLRSTPVHARIIDDGEAIARMLSSLAALCHAPPAAGAAEAPESSDPGQGPVQIAAPSSDTPSIETAGGCAIASGEKPTPVGFLVAVLALVGWNLLRVWRRRFLARCQAVLAPAPGGALAWPFALPRGGRSPGPGRWPASRPRTRRPPS